MDLAERFWSKVDKSGDCWIWQACTHEPRPGFRYGSFGMGSRTDGSRHIAKAHRVAYLLEHGSVPQGMDIHHRCENTLCVRPSHLQALTERQHVLVGSSPPSLNARKTHCPRNHPLSGENLIVDKAGNGLARRCRICRREQQNAWDRKKYNEAKENAPWAGREEASW